MVDVAAVVLDIAGAVLDIAVLDIAAPVLDITPCCKISPRITLHSSAFC